MSWYIWEMKKLHTYDGLLFICKIGSSEESRYGSLNGLLLGQQNGYALGYI